MTTTIDKFVWSKAADSSYSHLAVSPDGRWVLYGCGDDVHIVEARTGVERASFTLRDLQVNCIAVSPDSRTFAVGSVLGTLYVVEFVAKDGTLDATCANRKRFVEHDREITAFTFSADGRYVVSASFDGSMHARDLRTDVRKIMPHGTWVNAVVAVPRSSFVVTAGGDGRARMWDLNAPGENIVNDVRSFGTGIENQDVMVGAAVSSNGRWLATVQYSVAVVRLFSLVGNDSRTIHMRNGRYAFHVSFSANSKMIAVATSGGCDVWAIDDGVVMMYHLQNDADRRYRYVEFVGRSNHLLATTTTKNAAQVWDLHSKFRGGVLAALGHPGWARFLLDEDGDHAILSTAARFV